MTFLPIIDRELRSAARRRWTYWSRTSAAGAAMTILGGFLLLANLQSGVPAGQIGPILFGIFSWLGFISVCAAGVFLTSDCVSEEKREGTLGLLFLTDLRGYDVVAGKLFATSLRAVYGLLAVCPVIAIAFLAGGVTGTEFWRLVIGLGNALFFSLAAGLLISSLSRDSQKALNGTVLLSAIFLLFLPFVDLAIAGWDSAKFVPRLSLASPSCAFSLISTSRPSPFWGSVCLTHTVAWLFLGLACYFTPRAWQERSTSTTEKSSRARDRRRFGFSERRTEFRRALLDGNPVRWLAGREFWMTRSVRAFLLAGVAIFALAAFLYPDSAADVGQILRGLAVLAFILWVASQGSRMLFEARRTGAMELLLVTPMSVEDIIRGHWWGLRRTFLMPGILLLLIHGVVGAMAIARMTRFNTGAAPAWTLLGYQVVTEVSSLITLTTGLLATAWFAMWTGVTAKKPHVAVFKTILFVKIIPAFVLGFAQVFLMFGLNSIRTGSAGFPWLGSAIIAILGVAIDLAFIAESRRKLLGRFRELASGTSFSDQAVRPPSLPKTFRG